MIRVTFVLTDPDGEQVLDSGRLQDAEVSKTLATWLAGFVDYVEESKV